MKYTKEMFEYPNGTTMEPCDIILMLEAMDKSPTPDQHKIKYTVGYPLLENALPFTSPGTSPRVSLVKVPVSTRDVRSELISKMDIAYRDNGHPEAIILGYDVYATLREQVRDYLIHEGHTDLQFNGVRILISPIEGLLTLSFSHISSVLRTIHD